MKGPKNTVPLDCFGPSGLAMTLGILQTFVQRDEGFPIQEASSFGNVSVGHHRLAFSFWDKRRGAAHHAGNLVNSIDLTAANVENFAAAFTLCREPIGTGDILHMNEVSALFAGSGDGKRLPFSLLVYEDPHHRRIGAEAIRIAIAPRAVDIEIPKRHDRDLKPFAQNQKVLLGGKLLKGIGAQASYGRGFRSGNDIGRAITGR